MNTSCSCYHPTCIGYHMGIIKRWLSISLLFSWTTMRIKIKRHYLKAVHDHSNSYQHISTNGQMVQVVIIVFICTHAMAWSQIGFTLLIPVTSCYVLWKYIHMQTKAYTTYDANMYVYTCTLWNNFCTVYVAQYQLYSYAHIIILL